MDQQSAAKYVLDIEGSEKPIRVPRSLVDELKGAVSGKMMRRMKKEAVSCPVKDKKVSFLECFGCSNFLHRLKGKVGCKGQPEENRSV